MKDYLNYSNEDLCVMYQNGDKLALEYLYRNNTGLIETYAKLYYPACRNAAIDYDDLKIAAWLGMQHAAEIFDIEKGFKFTTLACWWIKREVIREINKIGNTVRITEGVNSKARNFEKCFTSDECEGIDDAINIYEREYGCRLSREEANNLVNIVVSYYNMPSLNAPTGDEHGTEFGDLIESKYSTEDKLFEDMNKSALYQALSELDEKESSALAMRYGLLNYDKMTYSEISKMLGLSSEGVRQIVIKAKRKLRFNEVLRAIIKYEETVA